MRKRFLSIISIAGLLLILFPPQLLGEKPDTVPLTNLMAGVAKVDITPPIGIPLGGYGIRQGPATGIHDPLYAVVIVFDDGETRAAIVSLDILQVFQQTGDSIRSAIQSATGIHKDHIIINASHTHGSPWIDSDIHYQKEVIAKTAGAARIAVSRLRPVSLGYGEGEIDFNISRRTIDADGKCHPKLNPNGICDHRVKVLRLDDSDSMTPMSVIMHVVCHSNVFRGENTEVSGDFPGVAKSFIERAYNNSTTAMFLQGCAGDIRPNLPDIDTEGDGYGRSGNEADITWCGWTLGTEVIRVATKLRVHEQLVQRQSHFKITAAMATLELDADSEKLRQATLQRDRIVGGKSLLPIQVIKIGDIWFVGLPGEPVVEYGLQIEKNMEGLGKVFVMGFSAGDAGYIPVEHMFKEGGYEAECPYTPSCEKVILDGVDQLVKEVLEKSKYVNCPHTVSPSCDTWVALGNSTKDGSVIMGKNSDRPSVEAQPLEYFPRINHKEGELVKCTHIEISQAEVTYAHIGSKIWWTFGYEHGTNEWGVAIGNEADGSKEPFQKRGLLGMDLVRLALERGKSAYEAMHVITKLMEEYGQGGGCEYAGQWDENGMYHNSFIIADPNEAWVLETAGKYWVAKKVEDVWAISNSYSIETDFDEAHPNLIKHAIEMGWCKSNIDFSFAYCYTDPSRNYSSSQSRANLVLKKLKDNKGDITVEFMMNEINRSHHEGTIETPKWSPTDGWFATPCMHDNIKRRYRTAASMVVHLRKEMPSMLSKVYWASFSTPCVNVFRPFYFAGQTVPDQYGAGTNIYSEDSPWWWAEKVKRLCDLNYNRLAPVVKGVFSETEKWELARSKTIESEVLKLIEESKNEEAEKILQDFSSYCCMRTEKEYKLLHEVLQQMIQEIGTDYLWIDFLRDNCETNKLILPGL